MCIHVNEIYTKVGRLSLSKLQFNYAGIHSSSSWNSIISYNIAYNNRITCIVTSYEVDKMSYLFWSNVICLRIKSCTCIHISAKYDNMKLVHKLFIY